MTRCLAAAIGKWGEAMDLGNLFSGMGLGNLGNLGGLGALGNERTLMYGLIFLILLGYGNTGFKFNLPNAQLNEFINGPPAKTNQAFAILVIALLLLLSRKSE